MARNIPGEQVTARSLFVAAATILIFGLNVGTAQTESQTVCTKWKQVNENAFGLGMGSDSDYSNEEGFETFVFNGQLYLGMEADNSLGARLWRTKTNVHSPASQADWEEVAADDQGNPFGIPDVVQNDHIDSLMSLDSYLYASTANRSGNPSGARVFRSPTGDPGSWADVLVNYGPGFGDPNNENFKDMQTFKGELCGGTWNLNSGAQVWCSPDGTQWRQRNVSGFGEHAENPSNARIWSAGKFDGGLYFGVQNNGSDPIESADDVALLYRSTDLLNNQWVRVFEGESGSRKVDILGELDNNFYISTEGDQGLVVYRSPSGDAGTWTQVSLPGMGDPNNAGTVVDGALLYNGALYLSITNWSSGVQVWRTTGIRNSEDGSVDWLQVSSGGFGDPNNTRAQLIEFNDYLYAWTSNFHSGQKVLQASCPTAKYLIVLIADGMGPKHVEATIEYTQDTPSYLNWSRHWMTTYAEGSSYDPAQAWSDFDYVRFEPTDSAAAATAMFTGNKTSNGRISVSSNGSARLFSLADKARLLGKGLGSLSSVYISHATPGAWYAHNDSRSNGYAIAEEGLWGDPNTTGDPVLDPRYGGGHGPSEPRVDIIVGAGHPLWNGGDYVNPEMVNKLSEENDIDESQAFVQRVAGSFDGGLRLIEAASQPNVERLVGLFGGVNGNLEYRLADGSGQNSENPTLAEMTEAALIMLHRNPDGFLLMIESGAVDWASHSNAMDQMVGEMIDFNNAIEAVVDWVNDANNDSSWENTLVVVTGDHETGYLTAAPGAFPDQALGTVNPDTIEVEKSIQETGLRASWEDTNGNAMIDPGETVYWAWNSKGHTNTLIPLFAKGNGAELFSYYLSGDDPVRGLYLDNTDLFKVLDAVTTHSEKAIHTVFLPLVSQSGK